MRTQSAIYTTYQEGWLIQTVGEKEKETKESVPHIDDIYIFYWWVLSGDM